MTARIACDLLLLASIFLLPWWVTAFFAIVFLFIFDYFWEMAVAGILLDVLYSFLPEFSFHSLKFSGLAILILAISLPLKNRLKFYSLKR